MTDKLLPCPFCGGEVKLTTYRDEGWEIKCENHDWPNATCERPLKDSDVAADVGMYSWGLGEDAKAALIAAWNARYHCGLTDEDYNILLDELGVSERTCEFNVVEERIPGKRQRANICECSNCGYRCAYGLIVDERFKFCPNCGARAVGE